MGAPEGLKVMHQRWSRMLFLHWRVAAQALRPLIPAGLEIDTFEGAAYVGLVPFTITGIRPPGLPALPLLSHFHEVNLRTYVRPPGREAGVWFFSLDAASRLAVMGARSWYRLPYHFARIEMEPEDVGAQGGWAFRSHRHWPAPVPARCSVRYGPRGEPRAADPGTIDHFLIERYVLYSESRNRIWRARVRHPPYPVHAAQLGLVEETLSSAAGVPGPAGELLAHYCAGVSVEIFAPSVCPCIGGSRGVP